MRDIWTIAEVSHELKVSPQVISAKTEDGTFAILPHVRRRLFFWPFVEFLRDPDKAATLLDGAGHTQQLNELPSTLCASEVADYLRLSKPTVHSLINAGAISRCQYAENKHLVSKSELFRFITQNQPFAFAPPAQMRP